MKAKIFLLFLLFLGKTAFAQSNNQQQFTGTILKKGWTKTSESYCAGGSDYYVLKTEAEEEIVLEYKSEKLNEQFFKKWVGKKVTLTAYKKQKKIKNDNPMAQKPVSFNPDGKVTDDEYTCWVLKVIKVKESNY